MERFKVQSTGSGLKRSIKAYEEMLQLFKNVGAELVGDYYGKGVSTAILFQGITFEMTPHNFRNQTLKRLEALKKDCKENGDEFVRLTKKDNKMLYAEIKTFDGGIIEITTHNYGQFSKARKTFIDEIKKQGHIYRKPYLGAGQPIYVDFGCKHGFIETTATGYLQSNKKGCKGCGALESRKKLERKRIKEGYNLGEMCPELIPLWSSKNKESIYDIKPVLKRNVYWKCENGHEDYAQSPYAKIKMNQGCPICGSIKGGEMLKKNTGEKFSKMVKADGYTMIGEYIDKETPVLIDFHCGHGPIDIKPHAYHSGARCRVCTQSNGERIIAEYLKVQNIEYKQGLRLENNRFYDIYLPTYHLIIEVHGLQHYKKVDHFPVSGEEQMEIDRQKQAYAESLGYNYMVVDYREHKPKKALERFKLQFKAFKKGLKKKDL